VQLSFQANTTVNIQGQSLTATSVQSPPTPPANTNLIAAYELGPSNSSFNPALTLTLKYDEASLPAGVQESNLYIAYWDGSQWTALASTLHDQANIVTAQVAHFSTFAILGTVGQTKPPKSASFTVSDLSVMPASVAPGQKVTITATVNNTGESQGSYLVVLKLNGVEEASLEVTLGPAKSTNVTFKTSEVTPGSHTVIVGEKTAGFTVTGKTQEASPSSSLPLPIIAAGGLIVILLIIIIALAARRRSA